MSALDSFFSKRFNAAKCKTLLKLTIPRVKLLRNRREMQLKQMRREIAKLLETGQEATARIRVEHIIREEKMMGAQEILELFCELVSVRLPIIEAQRECPLDLKEPISSLCFAAPRCADLPELLQVQILFSSKYGKEFVSAATELMPECGVNRQLVELLSIRAPSADVKLKLLKEIAEEHELDWDPSASQSELLRPHEDLLNGPTQFVGGSKLPLPKEKYDEVVQTTSKNDTSQQSDSDEDFNIIEFPEVPKLPLQSNKGSGSAPEMLPFPAAALSEIDDEEDTNPAVGNDSLPKLEAEDMGRENPVTEQRASVPVAEKQFLPFLSPPSQSSASISVSKSDLPISFLKTNNENIDLQDVLAAAQAASESAERAAASARLAASIAQVRISSLTRKNNECDVSTVENPFHVHKSNSNMVDKQESFCDSDSSLNSPQPSSADAKGDVDCSNPVLNQGNSSHQPQRLLSMEDESYLSYPNLFKSQASNLSSGAESFKESK